MRFRLVIAQTGALVHEGVLPLVTGPEVLIWGNRSFIRHGEVTNAKADGGEVVTIYREASNYAIGRFG